MCGDLWKKPCATSSSIQRQLRYQHALDHDKGHGQHHCLGSCLPRTAPWLSAKTPHGSDHLPVVFSLQKTATEQSFKPHNSFRYERWGSDIVSKLRKRKPKKSTKGSRKSKKQLPWWDMDRKVLDGSSRGLNTASMPADRAQVNQGVGKVPKPIPASLRGTPARKLGKELSRMASRQNSLRSSFSFKKTANRSQLPT